MRANKNNAEETGQGFFEFFFGLFCMLTTKEAKMWMF